MKNQSIVLVTVATLLLGSACSTQRIFLDGEDRSISRDSYDKSQPFFIYGLGQTQEFDATTVCGKRKPVRIETSQTFVDGLLGAVTFGIYTPRTLQLYCR